MVTSMMVIQLSLLFEAINSFGPSWGWMFFLLWTLWQVYCPLPNHQTAFQSFRQDLTHRMDRHEIGQISLAENVDGVEADAYREIHDKQRLTTEDFTSDDDPPSTGD